MKKDEIRITIKRDINGNKIASVKTWNAGKAFSIQTNGNLPLIHRTMSIKDVYTVNRDSSFAKEIERYVLKHGTKSQKNKIGIEQ